MTLTWTEYTWYSTPKYQYWFRAILGWFSKKQKQIPSETWTHPPTSILNSDFWIFLPSQAPYYRWHLCYWFVVYYLNKHETGKQLNLTCSLAVLWLHIPRLFPSPVTICFRYSCSPAPCLSPPLVSNNCPHTYIHFVFCLSPYLLCIQHIILTVRNLPVIFTCP